VIGSVGDVSHSVVSRSSLVSKSSDCGQGIAGSSSDEL
jgi:hypothetical protein